MNIDKLAKMIADGFEQTADNMAQLNEKIDVIDGRLVVVETKLDKALYHDISLLESRVKRLEQKIGI